MEELKTEEEESRSKIGSMILELSAEDTIQYEYQIQLLKSQLDQFSQEEDSILKLIKIPNQDLSNQLPVAKNEQKYVDKQLTLHSSNKQQLVNLE